MSPHSPAASSGQRRRPAQRAGLLQNPVDLLSPSSQLPVQMGSVSPTVTSPVRPPPQLPWQPPPIGGLPPPPTPPLPPPPPREGGREDGRDFFTRVEILPLPGVIDTGDAVADCYNVSDLNSCLSRPYSGLAIVELRHFLGKDLIRYAVWARGFQRAPCRTVDYSRDFSRLKTPAAVKSNAHASAGIVLLPGKGISPFKLIFKICPYWRVQQSVKSLLDSTRAFSRSWLLSLFSWFAMSLVVANRGSILLSTRV